MGKKGRKTRWRKLPISIGNGHTTCGSGVNNEEEIEKDDIKNHHHHHHHHQVNKYQHQENNHQPVTNNPVKTTFNEDEYTKITTPRQDMLFKKGYLAKKKSVPVTVPQDSIETQSADSIESDQYMCEDQVQSQYMYPNNGYIDSTGLYYINNGYEMYDPYYTGNMMVVVGPGYPTGPHTGVLTAVPCQPVPLQPLEWFNPSIPQTHPAYSVPVYSSKKKRNSIDSQNCSGQSSETTGTPGSPQEPIEGCEPPIYPTQYVYPGYMFGAPLFNMNGVTVQGVVPQSAPLPPPADQAKRRKKRRRRRRGGVTDEGSESSCEDILSCDASGVNESHSGASSDTAPGSSSSKTNSDSGIHTDPTALTSGANSPRLPVDEPSYFHEEPNSSTTTTTITTPTEENVVEVSSILCEQEKDKKDELDDNKNLEIIDESCQRMVNTDEEKAIEEKTEVETEDNHEYEEVQVEEEKEEEIIEHEEIKKEIDNSVCDGTLEIIEQLSGSLTINNEDEQEKPSVSIDSVLPQVIDIPNSEEENDINDISFEEDELTDTFVKDEENGEIPEKSEFIVNEEINVNVQSINNEINIINDNDLDLITNHLDDAHTVREESCERPITEAVTKWLRSQGGNVIIKIPTINSSSTSSESEDEGIEEGEDALVPDALSTSSSTTTNNTTGQKNVEGNPFPVLSPSSDNGTRVANYDYPEILEINEWTATSIDEICNAKRSVHKYYNLGTATSSTDMPAQPAVLLKTAMHIGNANGPFPCGVCCILQ